MLAGGDRRSIGEANQAVAAVVAQPARFAELIESLWHDDPVVRMRAADAAEKITRDRPELLRPFKAELLGLAAETSQSELRWHLAMMLPRLSLTSIERERVTALMKEFLNDRSSIVKTSAIQGLVDLAENDATLQLETLDILERYSRTGTAAMRARSRNLLKQLQK